MESIHRINSDISFNGPVQINEPTQFNGNVEFNGPVHININVSPPRPDQISIDKYNAIPVEDDFTLVPPDDYDDSSEQVIALDEDNMFR